MPFVYGEVVGKPDDPRPAVALEQSHGDEGILHELMGESNIVFVATLVFLKPVVMEYNRLLEGAGLLWTQAVVYSRLNDTLLFSFERCRCYAVGSALENVLVSPCQPARNNDLQTLEGQLVIVSNFFKALLLVLVLFRGLFVGRRCGRSICGIASAINKVDGVDEDVRRVALGAVALVP